MEFWEGLFELLLSQNGTISEKKDILLGIFAAGSASMGVIVVLLDFFLFHISERSVLKLGHRGVNIFSHLLLWGMGAGFGGFLGAAAGIMQINRAACLTAGIGWPLILPRLVESVRIGEENQEETEEV